MAYTAQQKEEAIAIVRRYGEISQQALDSIWEILGITPSKSTVHGWVKSLGIELGSENRTEPNQKNELSIKRPVTIEGVDAADERLELDQLFKDVARKYLAHAVKDDVVSDLKGQQAVTAAAIATDKILKLREYDNLPSELLKALPDFIAAVTMRNMNPTQIIIDMTNRLNMMGVENDSSLH